MALAGASPINGKEFAHMTQGTAFARA